MSKTRDHAKMEKRRKRAGKLFAKDLSAPEVVRRLGVDLQTNRQIFMRLLNIQARAGPIRSPHPLPSKRQADDEFVADKIIMSQ